MRRGDLLKSTPSSLGLTTSASAVLVMCPLFPLLLLLGCCQGVQQVVRQILPSGCAWPLCNSFVQPRSAVSALRASRISCQAAAGTHVTKSAAEVEATKPATAPTGKPAKAPAPAEEAPKGPVTHGAPMVIGLSHKTATVEVREKLSINEADWNVAAERLCDYDAIDEASVLSTCNRFELYLVGRDHDKATREAMEFLSQHSGLSESELRPNLFMLHDQDATAHLLRVSSGLDSLVVGEGQILSQVKACYDHAIAPADDSQPAGSAGKVLGRLLNTAVMAGKFVRTETEIAKGAVSISSAAVELAIIKAPEDLPVDKMSEARVTILGAGKMSRLAITHLASHGVTKLNLLNRGHASAEALAAEYPDLDIQINLMDQLWPVMARSDLVFASTSSNECIITLPELQQRVWGQDKGQELVLIDISVPRNVESECNKLKLVKAYNVADLKQVVAKNQAARREKVLEAEVLLRAELEKFVTWQESLKYVPSISKMQQKFESVREAALAKATRKALKNLSDKERQAVDMVTKSIVNKLLHAPMSYLRSDSMDGSKATVQQIEELFQLRESQNRGRGEGN